MSDYSLFNLIKEEVDRLESVEFKYCLGDCIKTIKCFLKTVPTKDAVEWNNIYISCLLTFINSITLSEKEKDWVSSKYLTSSKLQRLYENKSNYDAILYNLPYDMNDYIKVLVKRIKHIIAKDLTISSNYYVSSSNDLYYLIKNEQKFKD